MLKNILIGIFAAILVVAIGTVAFNAIEAQAAGNTAAVANGSTNGNGYGGNGGNEAGTGDAGNGNGVNLSDIPVSDLTTEEAASLIYMREEEKLARDVYNQLYEVWGLPTFQNIAASEQNHMDEVSNLLARYDLPEPPLEAGVFTNSELQDLYNALVARGSQSAAEALLVGGAIEEIDILDLQESLAQTDNADIQLVYNNLMNGSYSHLRAFSSAYTNQTGEIYTAQYMTDEMLQSILSGQSGNGYGNSNQNGSNGNAAGGSQSQVNVADAYTVQGTVSAYQYGTLTIVTTDGQIMGIELGNQNYTTTLGFVPQVGDSVTVYGFPSAEGLFSAITVTVDSTGQVFTFRDLGGRPSWAGGNGKGGGNH
jgi:hypothetical protein